MRILFISNFYPPARPGGYTQWCHEIAEALKERGHTIGVLTSSHEQEKAAADEEQIYRILHLDGDLVYYDRVHFFLRWRREKRENEAKVERVIRSFEPDLVFVWGMWAMAQSVPAVAEQLMGERVVYFLSDYWPAATDMHTRYWNLPAQHWYTKLPRAVVSRVALGLVEREGHAELAFEHPITVSKAVRDILVDEGVALEHARVIHGGTRLNGFAEVRERQFTERPLRLLYAGQIVEHKGVHTAVEAMVRLVKERGLRDISLEVVGSGQPEYEAALRSTASREGVEPYVNFRGHVAKEEMPDVLNAADVLLFPSIYEEPFARMTQEAMLAGLVVVGTTTGGTKEILQHGLNGLTFPAGDAAALAAEVARLVQEPALCRRLAAAGRQKVLDHYTLDRMADQIEAYLVSVDAMASKPTVTSS